MNTRRLTTALVCTLVMGPWGSGRATTYISPQDFDVVCLDLETGRAVWRSSGLGLELPKIEVRGELLRVNGTVWLSKATGERVEGDASDESQDTAIRPLAPVPVNLVGGDGTRFSFRPGYTRDLMLEGDPQSTLFQKLPSFPGDLSVAGPLVIFVWSTRQIGAGEVVAFDYPTRRVEWEFQAWRRHPDLPEGSHTSIAIDGDTVLVSADQVLYGLGIVDGSMRWIVAPPRQEIRYHDSAWTTFFAEKDKLLVRLYEDWVVLDRRSGRFLWSFDPGEHAGGEPTVEDGFVYLGARGADPVAMLSYSRFPRSEPIPSTLRVSRKVRLWPPGHRFSLEPAFRRDVPGGSKLLSVLNSPAPADSQGWRLRLIGFEGKEEGTVDLSKTLEEADVAYVSMTPWTRYAELREGDSVREGYTQPRPAPPRSPSRSIRSYLASRFAPTLLWMLLAIAGVGIPNRRLELELRARRAIQSQDDLEWLRRLIRAQMIWTLALIPAVMVALSVSILTYEDSGTAIHQVPIAIVFLVTFLDCYRIEKRLRALPVTDELLADRDALMTSWRRRLLPTTAFARRS
ncbi:MAG: PQQ-binding-like beta-propeller repeat protein [Deltaproteobacteria bacterium]|nr:PQQ-binding-like beta-propeller repeat protein [Deltaproteobacteria bacterium]